MVTPDARVVVEQHASLPASPVIPKTTRNLAIGLALGVLLGIGLAVLRDRFDNTVKDRETLEEITGVGLVGNIPLDKERRKEPAISFARRSLGNCRSVSQLSGPTCSSSRSITRRA